jgi:hypothetical protein
MDANDLDYPDRPLPAQRCGEEREAADLPCTASGRPVAGPTRGTGLDMALEMGCERSEKQLSQAFARKVETSVNDHSEQDRMSRPANA